MNLKYLAFLKEAKKVAQEIYSNKNSIKDFFERNNLEDGATNRKDLFRASKVDLDKVLAYAKKMNKNYDETHLFVQFIDRCRAKNVIDGDDVAFAIFGETEKRFGQEVSWRKVVEAIEQYDIQFWDEAVNV